MTATARDECFEPTAGPAQEEAGRILLPVARSVLHEALDAPYPPVPVPSPEAAPWLYRPGASFVTLTREGELRGCIGSLEARRPLLVDVRANARNAAFRDPRFSPLVARELPRVRVEVSVLTPPKPLVVDSEEDALRALVPFEDGIVLEYGPHRATFLPEVWEQLPDPERFLAHLKMKAGLPWSFWAPGIRLERYRVTKWKEPAEEILLP